MAKYRDNLLALQDGEQLFFPRAQRNAYWVTANRLKRQGLGTWAISCRAKDREGIAVRLTNTSPYTWTPPTKKKPKVVKRKARKKK